MARGSWPDSEWAQQALKLPLRISEEADVEMAESVRWYEEHLLGLGGEFLAAVDAAVARIEANPQIGSWTPGVDDEDIRRIFGRRFSCHVV